MVLQKVGKFEGYNPYKDVKATSEYTYKELYEMPYSELEEYFKNFWGYDDFEFDELYTDNLFVGAEEWSKDLTATKKEILIDNFIDHNEGGIYSEDYAKGGEVMSFEEFKKNLPNDVMSPYFGEDDVRYIRKYDKYSDRQRYIRHGRSNLDKIGLKDAYGGYLEDMKQKTYAKGGEISKKELLKMDGDDIMDYYFKKQTKMYQSMSDKELKNDYISWFGEEYDVKELENVDKDTMIYELIEDEKKI